MGVLSIRKLFRIAVIGAALHCRHSADGHGYLTGPRSRNLLAAQETNWASPTAYDPAPENCPQCLNVGGTRARCGMTEGRNYDAPRNALGGLMKTSTQATYAQGQDVVMDVTLTAHHKGHFVFSGCPIRHGEIPSQRCFDNNQLTFVEDLLYNAKFDPNYPERAYIAPSSRSNPNSQGVMKYSFKMRLPSNLLGDLVLIQWYYLTANSCTHEGYAEYDWPWNDTSMRTLPNCGRVRSGVPEQFWNCAEVKIERRGNGASTVVKRPDVRGPTDKNQPAKQKDESKSSSVDDTPPTTGATDKGSYDCPRGTARFVPTAGCAGYVQCNAAGGAAGGPIACPPGTLFDVKSNVCNFPQWVQCGKNQPAKNNDKSKSKKNDESKSSSADDTPPTTGATDKGSYNCPRGTARFVPTAGCAGYVQCNAAGGAAGGPIACPSGLLFDVKSNVCNFAQDVRCATLEKERLGENDRSAKKKRSGKRKRRDRHKKPGKKERPGMKKRTETKETPGREKRNVRISHRKNNERNLNRK